MIFQIQTARSPAVETSDRSLSRPLLQRRCRCGSTTASLTAECAERRKKKLALESNLPINEPDDALEQEADRVAEQVLSRPAHSRGDPAKDHRKIRSQSERAPHPAFRAGNGRDGDRDR